MATEELGSLRCSANRPCSLSRWRKESASQAIKLVTQSGMALPCSSPSHGALLRNNSKLHGTRAIAQVLQQHQFKPISCSGQSANRSATRTCFHSRTYQTTRSILIVAKSRRKGNVFPQVPVTAYLKELLQLATVKRPLLIFLDSVDELTGSQVFSSVVL